MKKLIGLLGMMVLMTVCFAQKRPGTLDVMGTAKFKKSSLDGVVIEVFKDGVPYTETESNYDGSFEFTLVGEGNYIVKAFKEGYHDRYMLFSTHVGEKGYKSKSYDFDLLFYSNEKDAPAKSLEIPVISYDDDKRNFEYSEML